MNAVNDKPESPAHEQSMDRPRGDVPARRGLFYRLSHIFAPHRPPREASGQPASQQAVKTREDPGGNRPKAHSMMRNLLQFADLRVDDVMVARAEIIAVDERCTMQELMKTFKESNHSRMPVYRETLDETVGMVHIKDLIGWLVEAARVSPRRRGGKSGKTGANAAGLGLTAEQLALPLSKSGLVREILFVPPSMPASDLLVKMQAMRLHMAVVVDEYGGTDGLVSIEDLVEQIVGDISDEHDEDEGLISRLEDGTYTADARVQIEEVEALLGVRLLPEERDDEAETLGGLMFAILGRVPARGELIRHESGVEFEVVGADPRRVKSLRIRTPASARRRNRGDVKEAAE